MADDASSLSQQRPVGVACTPCRRSKMKCVSSDPETTTCDRCQRLHRNCVYELHRRGQWRRDHTGRRAERQHSPPDHAGGDHGNLVLQIQRPGLESRASGSYSVSPRSEQSSFTPGALDTALDIEGSPDITLTNGFDIQQPSMEVTANMPTTQDLIELGLISEKILTQIVNSVIDSLNRWEHHWGNRSREPLQVAIMVLYRDYTCLYFNIRLLDYGPHHQTAVHACLSNALGILEQTYHIGEMAGLRYLWYQAHSMTAYAAMLIPKVIAWSTEDDTMWKQQATEMLDRVASKYLAAMSNPEGSPPSRVSVTMAAQGRLLGAIQARLNHGPRSYIPTPAFLQEDMNPYDFPNDISTLSGFLDLGDLTLGEGDYTADSNVELEALDDEFLRSRYHEAGLAALDEPGILLHAS